MHQQTGGRAPTFSRARELFDDRESTIGSTSTIAPSNGASHIIDRSQHPYNTNHDEYFKNRTITPTEKHLTTNITTDSPSRERLTPSTREATPSRDTSSPSPTPGRTRESTPDGNLPTPPRELPPLNDDGDSSIIPIPRDEGRVVSDTLQPTPETTDNTGNDERMAEVEKDLTESDINYLKKIYLTPSHPASFSSPAKLHEYVKKEGERDISLSKIKRWLHTLQVYYRYKPAFKISHRRPVWVSGKYYQYDIDSAYMTDFKKFNNNIGFFVLAIDVMTRFIWTEPAVSLKSVDIAPALRAIFDSEPPVTVRSDRGSEYIASSIQSVFDEYKIKHFTTTNTEIKAHFAEHGIKIIKNKLYKAMDHFKTKKWVELLREVTESYNKTTSDVLNVSPYEAKLIPDSTLRQKLYYDNIEKKEMKEKPIESKVGDKTRLALPKKTFKYQIGQSVVISGMKTKFHKGYLPQWSGEVFFIYDRETRQRINVYRLKTWENIKIEGTFYSAELTAVYVPDDTSYVVDTILEKRTLNGVDEVLVRWEGFPDSHITWVPQRTTINGRVLKRKLQGKPTT